MKVPQKIIEAITKGQSFLAHAHIGPDADSVGSILALKLALESEGKLVHLFSEDHLPPHLAFLPQTDSIENIRLDNALTYEHDLYLCLDTAKWELASHQRPVPLATSAVVNVDHHPDNAIKSKLSWVDPQAASASQMVYFLLRQLKIKINPDIATCLLAGLLHDTDKLQNSNVTPATLELVARLAKISGRYQQCILKLAKSYHPDQLKFWALLLSRMKLSPDNSFVYVSLDNEQYLAHKGQINAGNFANAFIGRVQGTDFGALLIEKKPGLVKGDLRARRAIDVSQIAHLLGGGGHKAAAGFRLEKNLAQAEKKFLDTVDYLKSVSKL